MNPTAHERADWERCQNRYRQLVATLPQDDFDEHLAGEVAKAMARTCAAYDFDEETFVWHLLEIMCEVDPHDGDRGERFRELYTDHRFSKFDKYLKKGTEDRRRPVPFEAAVETCRRLRDINRLRRPLEEVPTACVLGGSTSYGRFFNTVGYRDNEPSDLDLLLIVQTCDVLPALVDALRVFPGAHLEQLDRMAARAVDYQALLRERGEDFRCIFSHKIELWPPGVSPDPFLAEMGMPGHYRASIHVVTVADFDFIILRDRARLDVDRMIFDYREKPPDRDDHQRAFSGEEVKIEREAEEVEGGYLTESRVCHLASAAPLPGERYYPGQFQNLILPDIELRWELERSKLYLPLYAFKVKVDERLVRERQQRPWEIQNIANSHTRRHKFAPYVAERVEAK